MSGSARSVGAAARPALWAVALITGCPVDAPTTPTTPNPGAAPQAAPRATPPEPPPCPDGWGRCETGNGCTTELAAVEHCGACNVHCELGEACLGGRCQRGVAEIAVGGAHSCLRQGDGAVHCWGLNGLGQLGVVGPRARTQPSAKPAVSAARAIAAGRDYTCALVEDGHVRCWGEPGALGRAGPGGGPRPMRVEGLDEVIGLDAAVRHACAVARDGAVWCWGSNVAQQLGFVNAEDEDPFAPLPLRIAGLPAALRVATGHAHSCAITRERKVHCWGDNRFGQLGDATTESRPSPAAVHDLADVADLSLGAFHSCARTRAGALYCWGRNEAGQLGLGDTTDRSTPARVALDGVQALSAGERHTCAIANARVHCWGEGEGGRLGDGDELDRSSPAPVQGIGDAVQVAAGERHSCALERGGDVQCWGVNDGQLGDGSTAQRMLPVRVEMPAAARD